MGSISITCVFSPLTSQQMIQSILHAQIPLTNKNRVTGYKINSTLPPFYAFSHQHVPRWEELWQP